MEFEGRTRAIEPGDQGENGNFRSCPGDRGQNVDLRERPGDPGDRGENRDLKDARAIEERMELRRAQAIEERKAIQVGTTAIEERTVTSRLRVGGCRARRRIHVCDLY